MTRAYCRCGQLLSVPAGSSDRVVCPQCGKRVRVRRIGAAPEDQGDGFLRFFCPCGRRLKVSAVEPPAHGKCPDCGRIVPVPAQGMVTSGHPEARTEDLSAVDLN